MKASELIEALQYRIEHYGDQDIVFSSYGSYTGVLEQFESVEDVTHEDVKGTPVFVLWNA